MRIFFVLLLGLTLESFVSAQTGGSFSRESVVIDSLQSVEKQFVKAMDAQDHTLVRKLLEGGIDLWREVDFKNPLTSRESQIRQHPFFFVTLASSSETLRALSLAFAAKQKELVPDRFGNGPGKDSALRFAVGNDLPGSIPSILKTWPWQLTVPWDTNDSIVDRPSFFAAISKNNTKIAKVLHDAGCPANLEFKRWYGFSLYPIDVATSQEVRDLLISWGAKDFVTFDRDDWTLRLLRDTALSETEKSDSNVVGQLAKGQMVRLVGRTTGERNLMIKVVASNGKQGFVSQETIEFEWGNP